ncbi:uncharacterized protein LOC143625553 [Bidens hawaiensis]|uniref:uncharacterized protein LOC143625553 n=1 Tax=Bidens hawaiensis TaxID=980011 RepID=UPI00404A868E
MTNITQHHRFHGHEDEYAPAHINLLIRVFKMFNLQGANEDAILLHLFPFTLSGRATTWLDSQPAGAFTTWELRNAFIKKYFPPAKALASVIRSTPFTLGQMSHTTKLGSTFRICFHVVHNVGSHLGPLLRSFTMGLLMKLKRELEQLQESNQNQGQSNSNWRPAGGPPGFQAPFKRNQGQYNNEGSNGQSSNNGPDLSKKLDEMMHQIVTRDQVTQKTLADHDLLIKNQKSALLYMQRSIGDIVRRLDERPPGQFSGSNQHNPAAQLKAITTHNGKVLGLDVRKDEVEVQDEEVMDEEIVMEVLGKVQNTAPVAPPVKKKSVEIRPSPVIDHSRVPYPDLLKHQNYTREYGHFLDMFQQLKINLPFIEALQHMPTYAKFLKDLLKRNDRLGEESSIPLMGDCSAVVLNRVPEKLSDPGVFTIPCLFGSDAMSHALADLGASELTPTRMSLSLADRSVKYLRGIIENFLVKVDKFAFQVDFLVLDMEADKKVPIILGHPFLRTAKALINVYDEKITFRVGDENVTYDVARSMRHRSDQDDFSCPLHSVYFINSVIAGIDSCFDYICGADIVGSNGLVDCDDLDKDESCENDSVCDEFVEISGLPEIIEVNEISCESEAGSVENLAPLEFKVLPSHLEYAYLVEGSNLPVIVSLKLTEEEKTKLIDVLKLHKGAIVLKLMDVGMIYPIFDSPWVSPTQVVPNKGEEIVLGHKISRDGIEVDRTKIDTISRLPPPTNVKAIRSFFGHAGFYQQFIKDFSKITHPMTRLLEKDVPFVFDDECSKAFMYLKEKLRFWGKREIKHFHPIYYASKTLNDAQENYTTTEKELLAVVFAFDKCRSYLVLSKTTVFTDHAALHFLFQKKDAKPRLIRWILLLFEFDIEIKDTRGAENVAADHLSRLEDPKREELCEEEIGDTFPHESINFVAAEMQGVPWFTDFANYLANGFVLEGMTTKQKRKFFRDVHRYVWDDPFLFKIGGDRILRRCVMEEGWDILRQVHEGLTGGHHGAHATAQKVFDSGKSFHLPVELEHRAYWALKMVNVDLTEAARKSYFQIHELEGLRDVAYSRSLNIKEKTKSLHDRRLKGGKKFKKGKLRSKWTGPYLVKEVFPCGVVELENPDNGAYWKVNGHRLKHYLGGSEESIEMEETPLDPSH